MINRLAKLVWLSGGSKGKKVFTRQQIAVIKEHLEESRTIYTVPLHVGQNVEVPLGSIVTFYDPKERGLS